MSVVSPTSRFAYIEVVSPTRSDSFRPHVNNREVDNKAEKITLTLHKSLLWSCFWAPFAPFAFRRPAKGTNILPFGLLQKLIIRYFPGPEDSQNLPEASCVEGR